MLGKKYADGRDERVGKPVFARNMNTCTQRDFPKKIYYPWHMM
jgi:hypothetical protein